MLSSFWCIRPDSACQHYECPLDILPPSPPNIYCHHANQPTDTGMCLCSVFFVVNAANLRRWGTSARQLLVPPEGSMTPVQSLLSPSRFCRAWIPVPIRHCVSDRRERWELDLIAPSSFKCYDYEAVVISVQFREPKNSLKRCTAQFLERTERPWHVLITQVFPFFTKNCCWLYSRRVVSHCPPASKDFSLWFKSFLNIEACWWWRQPQFSYNSIFNLSITLVHVFSCYCWLKAWPQPSKCSKWEYNWHKFMKLMRHNMFKNQPVPL